MCSRVSTETQLSPLRQLARRSASAIVGLMTRQPRGLVTFLFTDIEGSTRLLQELGEARYGDALRAHCDLLRDAFDRHEGYEVNYEGDSFFVAFASAGAAVSAAADARRGLAAHDWPAGCEFRVRMGLHTGRPLVAPPKYVGLDVHRAARIAAAGHGGQVLFSDATAAALDADAFQLRDLGEHRFKDLAAPERVYQLGLDEFPPLTSLHRTNLPIPATPFVGREREVAEVVEIIARDDVRIVTLTGPGGTGKTRLAAQAAAEAAGQFPDGIWWIALASLRDPALVLSALAQTLGVKERPGEQIAETVTLALARKRALILLDNAEHLLPAIAGIIAPLVHDLDRARFLVTSREPLRIGGEREVPVPPLPEMEAVELFVERARAVLPSFEPDDSVIEICRRVDCLPLAVQLAAARTKMLAASAILARLERRLELLTQGPRDAAERQRTLRATIEWSYELLADDERRAFEALGVFVSGFSVDAAERAAGVGFDVLARLVDKSLVRPTEGRFFLLETIREFAVERLDVRPDANGLRRRHAEAYREFAAHAGSSLDGPEQAKWLHELELEHPNLRAALAWALEAGEDELFARLTIAVTQFLRMRGHLGEARRSLDRAVALDLPPGLRATALLKLASVAREATDVEAARAVFPEAIALLREHPGESDWTLSAALNNLGLLELDTCNYAAARGLFEESLGLAQAEADEVGIASATHNLGSCALAAGDVERAQNLFSRCLALTRRMNHTWGCAISLHMLAVTLIAAGRAEEAAAPLAEALTLARELDHPASTADILDDVAVVASARGDPVLSARLLGAVTRLRADLSLPAEPAHVRRIDRFEQHLRARMSDEAWEAAWMEGAACDIDAAAKEAFALLEVAPAPA